MPDPHATYLHPRRRVRLRPFLTTVLLALTGVVALPATGALAAGTDYYVDCSASSNGNGSSGSPWNSLAGPNGKTFAAGDRLLLKRGTTCSGRLTPGGSGSSTAVTTIDAYGTGARPVVDGGTGNDAAIKLFNQQYWDIQNVETKGGNPWGIYVSGNVSGYLQHIHITNVYVHDVYGTASDKETGGIVVEQGASGSAFNDVVIDGATVATTDQWEGIEVGTDDFQWTSDYHQNTASLPNTNVTIKNSTAHDIGGDGITAFHGTDVLITDNVAYNIGTATKATVDKVGTPNAIWTWWCKRCTVERNEAYASHSASYDGGLYDIDYWSDDSTVQYNYGHDADSYCYAIFAADNIATTNSVVRYNVCANNGRHTTNANQQDGALVSWGGGTLDGVQIYNNTHYWNPAGTGYPTVFLNAGEKSGTRPWIVKNNIFYSTTPGMVDDRKGTLTLDHNLYWTTSTTAPWWKTGDTTRSGLAAQQASGQDAHSLYADPKLNSPTSHAVGKPTTAFTLQSGSPAIDAGEA
ncbi:MAG TPA: right-handed parallel beta-helix repeat-containing protein, partial [Kineosporiaceae bacterium]|nr:right-handed parallel beta-helix repeat-containing protein [Kineosporiaceae bacterium]